MAPAHSKVVDKATRSRNDNGSFAHTGICSRGRGRGGRGGSRFPARLTTHEPASSPTPANQSDSDEQPERDSNRIGSTVAHGDISWDFKACGRLVVPGPDGVNRLTNQCFGRYPNIHLANNADVNLGDSDDDSPLLTMDEARAKWSDEVIFDDADLIEQSMDLHAKRLRVQDELGGCFSCSYCLRGLGKLWNAERHQFGVIYMPHVSYKIDHDHSRWHAGQGCAHFQEFKAADPTAADRKPKKETLVAWVALPKAGRGRQKKKKTNRVAASFSYAP